MAELVVPTQISREAMAFLVERNGEPDWVSSLRQQAWGGF